MAVLTVQDVVQAGLAETFANAASGGDSFVDTGRQETFLEIKNGSAGSVDVTIAAQQDSLRVAGVGPMAVDDLVVAVGAGARKLIGPFPRAYRDAQHSVSIAYSDATSVQVRAVRCAKVD